MRPRREIDWDTVNALRERGVTCEEIGKTLNIPVGTLRRKMYERRIVEKQTVVRPTAISPAPAKEKTLSDFQPREIIKHLYKLGYRIENNGLYVITKQQIKLADIISE